MPCRVWNESSTHLSADKTWPHKHMHIPDNLHSTIFMCIWVKYHIVLLHSGVTLIILPFAIFLFKCFKKSNYIQYPCHFWALSNRTRPLLIFIGRMRFYCVFKGRTKQKPDLKQYKSWPEMVRVQYFDTSRWYHGHYSSQK